METRAAGTDPERLKIGYVGGGSQNWAHVLMNDLARCPDLGGEVALYDVDRAAAERNARLGNRLQDRSEAVGDWRYEAYGEIRGALEGAEFVILSTQDDPAETFARDLALPKEYGIYQTVGDTVGPGGTLRAMRSIPQYREIAAAVRECCPDAWVFNYTNPMTVCTRTLYEEYPAINAVGLCHEVSKFRDLFAEMAARHLGVDRPPSGEIRVNVKGINHCTWIDEAYWRDENLFDLLDAELESREPIPAFDPGAMAGESYWVNHMQVAFDLYRRFGVLGAAGDRHLVEFLPGYLDVDREADVHRWGIRCTPGSARVDRPNRTERYLSGEERFEFGESGEVAVDAIRALLGLESLRTNVNVPNRGQVADLPRGAVVETNAVFEGGALRPLTAGSLPRPVRNVVRTHVENQETLLEAGFAGDLDAAFRAFVNDPLVDLPPDVAEDLFRDLVAAERDYLDDWNPGEAAILA